MFSIGNFKDNFVEYGEELVEKTQQASRVVKNNLKGAKHHIKKEFGIKNKPVFKKKRGKFKPKIKQYSDTTNILFGI